MPNILLCRIEYTRWWYVRSYRYHLPMDSVDLIYVVGCVYIRMHVSVLLYSTDTSSAYMARASLWSTYVFYIIQYFYTLWMLTCMCTCPFLWSRFQCFEHLHVGMVLYGDSSTLLICLVFVRERDTLCDIHAGFCSSSFMSVCNSLFLFMYCFLHMMIVAFTPSRPLFD